MIVRLNGLLTSTHVQLLWSPRRYQLFQIVIISL